MRKKSRYIAIDPDEIFLDSSNLPDHNALQFEGKIERPVATRGLWLVGAFFIVLVLAFGVRAWSLQVSQGSQFADISRNNTLSFSILFAPRGIIYDRFHKELAWNDVSTSSASSSPAFGLRKYTKEPGFALLLGWLRYPKQDSSGFWWREEYTGMSGVEQSLDPLLRGKNGSVMLETDARGTVQRDNIVAPGEYGENVHLSIDSDIQSKLFTILWQHAKEQGFVGGAGVIMDVRTGELIALTSFPEYDNSAFTDGNAEAVKIASNDVRTPLIDRAISGLYVPGSIVKPIFAIAALHEGIISATKQILSTGKISVPNPYDKEHPSVFNDWAVHGLVDMRTALAVSSDEYFYTIGGGYGGQEGLGIDRIGTYARMFGLATTTGVDLFGEESGVIPSPAWKEKIFGADDPWRIGDTFHTAIGQYGFQITPIQAVRYVAAIANGGKLFKPEIIASSTPEFSLLPIPDSELKVAREGMRLAVTSDRFDATVKSLAMSDVHIAGKTGTAQIGTHNQYMNSWSVGFWPSENPRYAYAVVLEKGKAGTLSGAAPGMRPFFEWLASEKPEYAGVSTSTHAAQ